jgi:hypothetical protein
MFVKVFFQKEVGLACSLLRGQDREGPLLMEGKLLSGHEDQQRAGNRPGAAGGSFEGLHRLRQSISGQAAPGAEASAGGAQVVDLAGDVPLQAADDLLLRQSLFGAPAGVGPGWQGESSSG